MDTLRQFNIRMLRRFAGPAMFVLALFLLVGCISTTVPGEDPTVPASSPVQSVSEPGPTDSTVVEILTAPPTEPPLPPVTWVTYPADRKLTATAYFVYDLEEEWFVRCYGEPDAPIYPASITKLFTAYVALQYIDPGDPITVGDELLLLDPGSSIAGLQPGTELTAEQLIAAMLLPSGNDAAYTTAATVGRIIAEAPKLSASAAVRVFIEEMNTQAQMVGMTNSHFVTPDGIHSSTHVTTFRDLVTLAQLVLEDEVISRYTRTPETTFLLESGAELTWKNTNPLIRAESDFYCPYALGLKTGQTTKAGSCLLTAFECNSRRLIIGVFGAPDYDCRAADSLQLFNEAMGFEHQTTEPATEADTTPTE